MSGPRAVTVLNFLIVVWLAITSAGLVYGIRLVIHARRARAWFRLHLLNGYREIVANGAIHRGEIRIFIFVCMVLMGIDASVVQFYPVGSPERTVLSAAFRLLFIVMALAFTYKSYLEEHELDLLVNEDQRRRISRVYEHAGNE